MNEMENSTPPVIRRVLHPTDFSAGSKIAFYHALKAALLSKSKLMLLNVSLDGRTQWTEFPAIRETLERWGLLPQGSPRSAVAKLGIDAGKIVVAENDPLKAVLGYLERHPVDLIVLATHQREGRMRWLGKSVSQPVARRAEEMTLFIPAKSNGFVSGEDGSVSLTRILLPVASTPRPQPAIEAISRVVAALNCVRGTITLMHVGQSSTMPAIRCPDLPGWEWKKLIRSGQVVECIVEAANELKADLIVMATDGRSGFLEGLRGSHSEQVLRNTAIPLLTIPLASSL